MSSSSMMAHNALDLATPIVSLLLLQLFTLGALFAGWRERESCLSALLSLNLFLNFNFAGLNKGRLLLRPA